jgi:diamine N-acetyltransferase
MTSALEFIPVQSTGQIDRLAGMARDIWYEYYVPIIGRAQVDYMVEKFQSAPAMQRQLQEGYEYFLVREAAEDVGYCAVQEQRAAQTLFISKFYLARAGRGRGTGRRCMEFIEDLARRRALKSLWLTVNKGNPAVNVYKRLGFTIAAELVMDIGGGFVMDDFRMEKRLA